MQRTKLIQRVRSLTRDFTNSIFRETDIIDFINEAIDRFKQTIPQLKSLTYLSTPTSEPSLIPEQYQHLLAVYASSRCFGQDERHYQATTLMNEFEVKLEEMKGLIENGQLVIIDPSTGEAVTEEYAVDYVDTSAYWTNNSSELYDVDEGVDA